MKRLLKFVLYAGVLLLGFGLVSAAAGYWRARSAWPVEEGALEVPGLSGNVEVYRDASGVPHLFASNERDLFYGQGFIHAQDRLWQMALARAMARGELSELLGEAALDSDRAIRTLALPRQARRTLTRLQPETVAAIQSYCDGVNAFLSDKRHRLPVEFLLLGVEPGLWEPLDVALVGESISLAMSLNYFHELMRMRLSAKVGAERALRLLPPYPEGAPITLVPPQHALNRQDVRPRFLPPLETALRGITFGSNSWVVHGSRTATGKPILANDTHLSLPLPSLWYENGLFGGRYSVSGFSFPGAPFVAVGHNSSIAWGVTNMCSDVQDLYLEKLDKAEGARRYEVAGQWYPLEVSEEQIPVKDGPPVTLSIARTRHGPLINDTLGAKDQPPLALRWAASEGNTLFDALSLLDRASAWDEFRDALRFWTSPSLNFVYADVMGNIGYQSTGRIPIRADGHSGSVAVPGWTDGLEWKGYIPFDDLPSVTNPPSGFLVSANNKVVPDAYPYHLTDDWGDPYRAQRITETLLADDRVSLEHTRALQADSFSLPAKALLPFLLSLEPTDALERQALESVRGWDFRFEEESVAASVYYLWYANLLDEIIGDELEETLMLDYRTMAMTQTPMFVALMQAGTSEFFDDVRTPEREGRDEISARAFSRGIAWLRGHYGENPLAWRWGPIHSMTFVHQPLGRSGIKPLEMLFNSKTVPSSGEPYSVNATFHDPGLSFAVSSGPAHRFIADLSALERSVAATSTGQSGLLFHPHREDQVEQWRSVGHHPMLFLREDIIRAAKTRLVLRPANGGAHE